MSRFGNLEFDGRSEERPAQRPRLPRDEAHYLAEAQTAFENGTFEQALRLFARVIEFNPHNPTAWAGQVRMLIELGEFQEAALWADKALERFPQEAELLAAKGVALGRLGDLEGALAFSDAAMGERGDAPYIWLSRADVLLACAEKRADFCFDKAFSLAPDDWFVRWLAARIRAYYRQFALALKWLQQAVEWNATHFRLWLELGECQQAMGLTGPAHQSFAHARELNPDCDAARAGLRRLEQAGPAERIRSWWQRIFRT